MSGDIPVGHLPDPGTVNNGGRTEPSGHQHMEDFRLVHPIRMPLCGGSPGAM